MSPLPGAAKGGRPPQRPSPLQFCSGLILKIFFRIFDMNLELLITTTCIKKPSCQFCISNPRAMSTRAMAMTAVPAVRQNDSSSPAPNVTIMSLMTLFLPRIRPTALSAVVPVYTKGLPGVHSLAKTASKHPFLTAALQLFPVISLLTPRGKSGVNRCSYRGYLTPCRVTPAASPP